MKLVTNAGIFGLNVLIVVLAYKLADRWAAPILKALLAVAAAMGRSDPPKPDPPSPPSRGKEPSK